MILAEAPDYPSVITAMERGDMYASTGPEIHENSIENGVVHIACSPAKQIVLYNGGKIPAFAAAAAGETLTAADLPGRRHRRMGEARVEPRVFQRGVAAGNLNRRKNGKKPPLKTPSARRFQRRFWICPKKGITFSTTADTGAYTRWRSGPN